MTDPVFKRTEKVAKVDRVSKWNLIEAIAADAKEAGVPLVGVQSKTAAREALAKVGHDHAPRTIEDLCMVAKYDDESTDEQRQVWRRYGWSIVYRFSQASVPKAKAMKYLDVEEPRTWQETVDYVSGLSPRSARGDDLDLDASWEVWLNDLNRVMKHGAELDKASKGKNLKGSAGMSRFVYQQTEAARLEADFSVPDDLHDLDEARR